MTRLSLILICLAAAPAWSKDFGTHGHVYPIAEPDVLDQMTRKLNTLKVDGTLERHQRSMVQRTKASLQRPTPVAGMTATTKPRVTFYDPSITVPYDLKDAQGRVFHHRGTRVNPLSYRSLTKALVFIDGDAKHHVAWAAKQPNATIILVKGAPFTLMEAWGSPVCFDQGGTLTTKLGIRHVPARVTQVGMKLKIEELVVSGGLL